MTVLLLTAALHQHLPPGFDRQSFCDVARAIVAEAGSVAAAERLARERGIDPRAIWLAKRICRRSPS